MRTLILSDPHSNLAAVNSVLDHACLHYVLDEVWCLGDTVGYGSAPDGVWRTLQNEPILPGGGLAGNHDWEFVGKLHIVGFFVVNSDGKGFTIQNYRQEGADVLHHQQTRWRIRTGCRSICGSCRC